MKTMNKSHKPQFKYRPYESEPAGTAYLIRLEKFLSRAVKHYKQKWVKIIKC